MRKAITFFEQAIAKDSRFAAAYAGLAECYISGHRSKSVDEFSGQSFDYVLPVCDNAKESCPIYPGHTNRLHHNFEDPAAVKGSEEERLTAFRRVRDQIRRYLRNFPASGESA